MRETTSGLPAMAGSGAALRALHGARQPRSTSKRVSCLRFGFGFGLGLGLGLGQGLGLGLG